MRVPALLLTVTALTVAVTPAADAAARKKPRKPTQCRTTMTDPRGDASYRQLAGMESYDIVGGEMTNRAKTVTAILKLAGPPTTYSKTLGSTWRIGGGAAGVRYEFELRLGPTGSANSEAKAGGQSLVHSYELKDDTITWNATKAGPPRPLAALSQLGANSNAMSTTADDAQSTTPGKCF